jgi:hypothetical protein
MQREERKIGDITLAGEEDSKNRFLYGNITIDFSLTVDPLAPFWCYHTADMMGI